MKTYFDQLQSLIIVVWFIMMVVFISVTIFIIWAIYKLLQHFDVVMITNNMGQFC